MEQVSFRVHVRTVAALNRALPPLGWRVVEGVVLLAGLSVWYVASRVRGRVASVGGGGGRCEEGGLL